MTNFYLPSYPSILKIFKYNKSILVLFLILLAILLINTLHFQYPDEFDNIVGGHFILQGRLPYIGFFTHHEPIAYFYAAILELFSGVSFVRFRYVLSVSYFLLLILSYVVIKRSFNQKSLANLHLIYLFMIAIVATYDWGHMLVADSLVGYLFIPAYSLMFWRIFNRQTFRIWDHVIISVFISLILLTSLTYLYVVGILYLFLLYYHFKNRWKAIFTASGLQFFLIMITPYLLFLVYLLITGSLYDYYYQSIFFNKAYYITTQGGKTVNNPIRYALIIFSNFFDRYKALLSMIKDLNFGNPLPVALAVANTSLILYLLINKRFKLSLFIFSILIYSTTRTDPLAVQDTNYQGLAYHWFSLYNFLVVVWLLWQGLEQNLELNKKLVYSLLFLTSTVFLFYTNIFLFGQAFDKAFKKYMGEQALIYDRPVVADLLNSLLGKNDYYYIGPFAFEEHFYMKSKLASRYFITIPAMQKSDKIKTELMADIQKNKPKIIVFNTDGLVLGTHPAPYLEPFLKTLYFTIDDINYEKPKKQYEVLHPSFGEYDLARHFFFDKTKREEIIKQLSDRNLITLIR